MEELKKSNRDLWWFQLFFSQQIFTLGDRAKHFNECSGACDLCPDSEANYSHVFLTCSYLHHFIAHWKSRSPLITWRADWNDWIGIPSSSYDTLPGRHRKEVLEWLMQAVAARRDTLQDYHRSYRAGRLKRQLSRHPLTFVGKLLDLTQKPFPTLVSLELPELRPVPPPGSPPTMQSSLHPNSLVTTRLPSPIVFPIPILLHTPTIRLPQPSHTVYFKKRPTYPTGVGGGSRAALSGDSIRGLKSFCSSFGNAGPMGASPLPPAMGAESAALAERIRTHTQLVVEEELLTPVGFDLKAYLHKIRTRPQQPGTEASSSSSHQLIQQPQRTTLDPMGGTARKIPPRAGCFCDDYYENGTCKHIAEETAYWERENAAFRFHNIGR